MGEGVVWVKRWDERNKGKDEVVDEAVERWRRLEGREGKGVDEASCRGGWRRREVKGNRMMDG